MPPQPILAIALPLFSFLTWTVAQKVQSALEAPYIDEKFHLRQAAAYCAHKFAVWDPKITTPPGLYLLATFYSHLIRNFGVLAPCGATLLRYLNLIGGVVVLPGVLNLVKTTNYWKINVVSLPILYTFYFFFYTDVWSTVFVLLSLFLAISMPTAQGAVLSGLAGFASLWFRQTNIIWVAFAGFVLVDIRRKRGKGFEAQITAFVKQALRDWALLLPFAANAIAFAVFLKVNGGITFGDKDNHQVSPHIVQVFYCAAFLAFFTLPLWFSVTTLGAYVRFAFEGTNILRLAVHYVAINKVIDKYTIVHPFLLADNRHYTFYIYRRILSVPNARYVLVPAYHFCIWVVFYLLQQTRRTRAAHKLALSQLSIIVFVAATVVTLVPSPLFEPRYYIVPLALLRIFSRRQTLLSPTQSHMVEFIWLTLINTVVFVVFFSYTFHWTSEEGVQRIIW